MGYPDRPAHSPRFSISEFPRAIVLAPAHFCASEYSTVAPFAKQERRGRSAAWRSRPSVASMRRRAPCGAPASAISDPGAALPADREPFGERTHPSYRQGLPPPPDRTSSLFKADPRSGAGRLPWASRYHGCEPQQQAPANRSGSPVFRGRYLVRSFGASGAVYPRRAIPECCPTSERLERALTRAGLVGI